MIKKLVISYSDDDRDLARKLRELLIKSNFNVWLAEEDIRGDVMWTDAIVDAITGADGLILLWSENSARQKENKEMENESTNVHEEVRIARGFQKPIFPILARPMSKIPALPPEILSLQVIGRSELEHNFVELKERLNDEKRSKFEYPKYAPNAHIQREENFFFVGREADLKTLFVDTIGFHGKGKKGLPIAISGLAGIGKTHLALTFGYRFPSAILGS